jgi:hypothetical protein
MSKFDTIPIAISNLDAIQNILEEESEKERERDGQQTDKQAKRMAKMLKQ